MIPETQTKQAVRDLLDRLPEDCSQGEVLHHPYVLQAVQAGLADADAGGVVPHAEVADALRRKRQLGEGQQSGRTARNAGSKTDSRTSRTDRCTVLTLLLAGRWIPPKRSQR